MISETSQDQDTGLESDILAGLWQPRFPSPELVSEAAALMPQADRESGRDAEMREGPRWEFTVGPGMVSIRSRDYARQERAHERQVVSSRTMVDQLAQTLAKTGEFPSDPEPSRRIVGWSRKSRARMVERLCTLDYSPLMVPGRLPAMITLTYPQCWMKVAPNGKAAKKHLDAFRLRWKRAWGEQLVCSWKQEFQWRRKWYWEHGVRIYNWCTCDFCSAHEEDGRAPHFHLLCSPPQGMTSDGENFKTWLSRSWAEVVNHPDPEQFRKHLGSGTHIGWNDGLRSTDPKRVAVYFTKHGSFAAKEYQHCVPKLWQEPGKGPGRFWGNMGLEPATKTVELTQEDAYRAARTLRRWSKAQGVTKQVVRPRVEQATGRIRYRNTRVRAVRLKGGRGFVSLNDGPLFASAIARQLAADVPETPDQRRARLVAATGSIQSPASSDTQPTTR